MDDVYRHIRTTCVEAGLDVMIDVYEIIRNREFVSDDRMLALDDRTVEQHYEGFVAPAIDRLESLMGED